MSVVKRLLIDPFTAKSTLSKLNSVSLAASYSTRARKPEGIKEVESWLDDYDRHIPSQLSRCNTFQDMMDAMPMVDIVTSLYQRAVIKTGWEDAHVEKRLRDLDSAGLDMLEWVIFREPSSLVKLFLRHGISSVNTTASTLNVRRVHALALRTGMLEDEWNRSRLIPLYLQSATSSLDAEHWDSVKDFCEAISTVDHLVSLYRQTAAETGRKDHFLEKKLQKMTKTAKDLKDWAASKNPRSSLVNIYLRHAVVGSVNTFSFPRNVKRVHALAIRTGMLEDDRKRSLLMAYYLQAIEFTLVDCERLFHGAESKGLLVYNQMMTVYSRHAPEKCKRLFDEMIQTCRPNGATYMTLLHALSVGGEAVEALKVVVEMKSHGFQPEPGHYGAVVDGFARKRTPDSIKVAIAVLKYFPAAQNEVVINSILSRCVSPPGVESVSEEKELELKKSMKKAQLDLEVIIKKARVEGLDLEKIIKEAGLDLERCLKEALNDLHHPETIKHFRDVLALRKMITDAQDVLELQEIIREAQDLVDYLEEKESQYAVQEKTHWRLEKCGLRWPRRVTKN